MAESIIVAGERLEDLEAALDHLTFRAEECGCIDVSGTMPANLSGCLDRALQRVESDSIIQGHDPYDDPDWHSMRQLLLRIGRVYMRPQWGFD